MINAIPEHTHEGRNSPRLEDGEQALPLMGQVVEDAGCGPCCLHVTCVLHGPDHCCYHLRGLHQRTPGCLLTCELVDDLCRLAYYNLFTGVVGIKHSC